MTDVTSQEPAPVVRSSLVEDVCRSLLPDVRQQQALDRAAGRLESGAGRGWKALSSSDNVESLQAFAAELHEIDQLLSAVAESAHRAAAVLKARLDAALWNVLAEETGLRRGDIFEETYEATGYVARVQLEEIALLEPNKVHACACLCGWRSAVAGRLRSLASRSIRNWSGQLKHAVQSPLLLGNSRK
ncbi:hypothetical protein P5W99_11000 [Paraburkholderia sp. A3BS-1L]|uniref:hypothetical protein n=1 Tax=Paraburkholderia sp. A3BS-1L TaxID=3028375 RepID=UPI003DA87CFD